MEGLYWDNSYGGWYLSTLPVIFAPFMLWALLVLAVLHATEGAFVIFGDHYFFNPEQLIPW